MASMNENGNDGFAALLAPTVPSMQDNSDFMPQGLDGSFNVSVQDQVSASLSRYDVNTLKSENRILRSKIKQLQSELQAEQDTVASVRKKLNISERERLDAVAKANEEVSRLDTEVTKIRAQLERAEAVRQDLEFQLSKAKRDVTHEKRNVTERESLLGEVNDSMKQKVDELTRQIESMCDELENTRLKANEDMRKLKRDMEEKDSEMGKLRSDVDAVENEKLKLENALTQSDNTIRELEERLQEVDDEKRNQGDELRRQITEMDMLREQHDMLRKDYEGSSSRVKSLEDSIEAERAAHLESKFNSEIVQLRLRDIENALDMEKSTKIEALTSTDKLNRQLRELQHIYDEERKLSLETKEKLEKRWMPILRAEKEYAALSKQLAKELDEKRRVIKDLSNQLEGHQKDFNELKQELSKAKKKQISLEETYSGCMKELDILHENFKFDSNGNPKKALPKKKVAEKKTPVKNLQPNAVMENLRKTLISYKRNLDEMTSNHAKEKDQKESLDKECKKYKDMIWTKDKALQTSRSGIQEASKELQHIQTDKREQEKLIKQLREDIDLVHRQLQKEKTQNRELAEQCSAVVNRSRADEKRMNEFMYHLYHQMCIDLPTAEKIDLSKRSFDDASVLLTDYASKLVNNCRWMNEKIRHLEVTIRNKEELVDQMQKAHEEQLEKLASIAEGRSQQWVQQKAEMENHYSQLLGEIHSRHKKTQTLADQAWEKVRMTGSVQQGLEKECDDLRKQLLLMRDEHECLLAACALLCGAIYPLYQRNQALSVQRAILQEQLDRFETFKTEIQKLVDALSLDNMVSQRKNTGGGADEVASFKSRERTPLLRFRAGAIAVVAANRMANITSHGQCKMFIVKDLVPGIESSVVCTGGIEPQQFSRYTGVADPQTVSKQHIGSQFQAVDWLCSANLLTTITATMGDLVNSVNKAKRGEKGYDHKKVVNTARSAYQKLVCHMPATFPTIQNDTNSGFRERNSLVRVLGYGLNRAIAHSSMDGSIPIGIESSHNTLSSLQKHMLEFTQRLHTAEVERRDLRIEVNKLQHERQNYTETSAEGERMAKEVNFLRQQVQNTVERERFEQICSELNRALQREQEAQQLLNEQSQQLHQLSLKLDMQVNTGSQNEHTLTEAVHGLTEAKMEAKRNEQRVRQLNRQIQQVENEKKDLGENVKDAENALRTAAKDKEALAAYMKTIEKLVDQIKNQLAYCGGTANAPSIELSRLLAPELVPANLSKISPELAECQTLVAAFVEALRQPHSKVAALYDEIEGYRKHIATLKQELSAACRREFDNNELDKLKLQGVAAIEEPYSPSRTPMGNGKVFNGNKNFAPLEEDMNDTYGISLVSPPPPKSRLPTAVTGSSRNPGNRQPLKESSLKRRPTEGGERR